MCRLIAVRELTSHVAGLDVAGQRGVRLVARMAEVEQGAGQRLEHQPAPSGVCRERAGGGGVDRPVAGKLGRVVGEAQRRGQVHGQMNRRFWPYSPAPVFVGGRAVGGGDEVDEGVGPPAGDRNPAAVGCRAEVLAGHRIHGVDHGEDVGGGGDDPHFGHPVLQRPPIEASLGLGLRRSLFRRLRIRFQHRPAQRPLQLGDRLNPCSGKDFLGHPQRFVIRQLQRGLHDRGRMPIADLARRRAPAARTPAVHTAQSRPAVAVRRHGGSAATPHRSPPDPNLPARAGRPNRRCVSVTATATSAGWTHRRDIGRLAFPRHDQIHLRRIIHQRRIDPRQRADQLPARRRDQRRSDHPSTTQPLEHMCDSTRPERHRAAHECCKKTTFPSQLHAIA